MNLKGFFVFHTCSIVLLEAGVKCKGYRRLGACWLGGIAGSFG